MLQNICNDTGYLAHELLLPIGGALLGDDDAAAMARTLRSYNMTAGQSYGLIVQKRPDE